MSDLSHTAYQVPATTSTEIRGIRLRPGVQIQQAQLRSWLLERKPTDLFKSDQLNEFCTIKPNVKSALDCLANDNQSVLCVAKELGVSLRTLERLVKAGTGQSPYYWFSLARARKAGRSFAGIDNLSEAAFLAGFSDQSHMNREIKKWFRLTPKSLKNDSEMLGLLFDSGYG
ncbi:MAG: helix-turn-helix domain-containing protein [Granulosicoccus sp.]